MKVLPPVTTILSPSGVKRGRHMRRVRSGIGLGDRQRRERSIGDTRQQAPLLLLVAEVDQRLHRVEIRRPDDAGRRAGPADFAHTGEIGRVAEPGPAIRLRHEHRIEAERIDRADVVPRELGRAVVDARPAARSRSRQRLLTLSSSCASSADNAGIASSRSNTFMTRRSTSLQPEIVLGQLDGPPLPERSRAPSSAGECRRSRLAICSVIRESEIQAVIDGMIELTGNIYSPRHQASGADRRVEVIGKQRPLFRASLGLAECGRFSPSARQHLHTSATSKSGAIKRRRPLGSQSARSASGSSGRNHLSATLASTIRLTGYPGPHGSAPQPWDRFAAGLARRRHSANAFHDRQAAPPGWASPPRSTDHATTVPADFRWEIARTSQAARARRHRGFELSPVPRSTLQFRDCTMISSCPEGRLQVAAQSLSRNAGLRFSRKAAMPSTASAV